VTAARGFATPESGSTLTVSRTDDDTDIRSVDLDGAVQEFRGYKDAEELMASGYFTARRDGLFLVVTGKLKLHVSTPAMESDAIELSKA